MKVVIHDRTERAGASLRSYAERKLERLSRHFDRVLQAEVHFDEDTRRSQTPVVVSRILVHATGRTHAEINAELNRKVGIKRISVATLRQLEQRLAAAQTMLRRR